MTTGTTINDASVTANDNNVGITLADGTKVKAGEVLTWDSERVLVESISGNVVTVERAVDGSVLAAHANGITVYAPRTLTVTRAENGTTATVHDTATVINKYAPPGDIVKYVRASAIATQAQDNSKWTGMIGGPDGGVETKMFGLWSMKQALIEKYGRISL